MPGFVIKEMPPELHKRLKEQAEVHHRSMVQEALTILEAGLARKKNWTPPPPIKAQVFITDEMINEAKREGRA